MGYLILLQGNSNHFFSYEYNTFVLISYLLFLWKILGKDAQMLAKLFNNE
jgi:hypothetical protein